MKTRGLRTAQAVMVANAATETRSSPWTRLAWAKIAGSLSIIIPKMQTRCIRPDNTECAAAPSTGGRTGGVPASPRGEPWTVGCTLCHGSSLWRRNCDQEEDRPHVVRQTSIVLGSDQEGHVLQALSRVNTVPCTRRPVRHPLRHQSAINMLRVTPCVTGTFAL